MESNEKKTIPTILLKEKAKLIISSTALNEINYLHYKVGETEWSGIALIDVQGDIDNIQNLKCIVKHVYPNNIGSGHFTSYNSKKSSIHLDILRDIPESEDLKLGFVHSHHSMETFFSGTDTGELIENSENYNWLLSLIVNFSNQFSAKLAFRGKREVEISGNTKLKLLFKNRLGKFIEKINDQDNSKKIEEDVVFIADFDIEIEQDKKWLKERISKLFKVKKELEAQKAKEFKSNFNNFNNFTSYNSYQNKINFNHKNADNTYEQLTLSKEILIKALDEEAVREIKSKAKDRELYINDIVHYLNDKYDTIDFDADEVGNGFIDNQPADIEDIVDYAFEISEAIDETYDKDAKISKKFKRDDYYQICLDAINTGLFPYQGYAVIRHLSYHISEEIINCQIDMQENI